MKILIEAKEVKDDIVRITEENNKIILWRNDIDFEEYNKEDIISLVIN